MLTSRAAQAKGTAGVAQGLLCGALQACVFTLAACKGDAPPSQPPQPPQPPTFHVPVVSSAMPALVAIRDDATATWQALAPAGDGYDVPKLARFTLVVVCAHWLGSNVELRHWTREDNLDLFIACEGFDGEALADVTPRFAPGAAIQTVHTGGAHEVCASTTQQCALRAGTHDTAVLHDKESADVRIKLHRGLAIFDGARIDADASRGWQPERRAVTIASSVTGFNSAVYVCLETARGDTLLCAGQTHWGSFPAEVTQSYLHAPAAQRRPGDCDVLDAPTTRICLRDPETRIAIAPRDVAMRYDGTRLELALADADALSVTLFARAPKTARWSAIATRRWLAGATSYAPPAIAVAGWRSEWSLPREVEVRAALVWGPKPSSARGARVGQRLAPGDRIDTHAATIR